jgi:hypothetical protein
MKRILLFVGAFFLGFVIILSVSYIRAQQTKMPFEKTPLQKNTFLEPTLALEPPANALNGYLTIIKGKVDKLSRSDSEYKEAVNGSKVLIGESVATKDAASAFIAIEGYVDTRLSANSEVSYANLFPENTVLLQKMGEVEYTIIRPISVRVLHTLVSMQQGMETIEMNGSTVSVKVTSGSAKIALVDLDNTTKVYELSAGKKATINDEKRTVKVQ